MLLTRILQQPSTCLTRTTAYLFARRPSAPGNKQKYTSKTDNFQSLADEYPHEYFEQYRKEVEKDTVVRDFRKQIFARNQQVDQINKNDKELDWQQNQLNKFWHENEGNREKINKYSKKVMNNILNNRSIFKTHGKSKENKDVFKDYAQYSAYKSNYVSIEDRNYMDGDLLSRPQTEKRTYQFIDQLPDEYKEKQDVLLEMNMSDPVVTENMTISEYGKMMQKKHDEVQRYDQLKEQYAEDNSFKMRMKHDEIMEDTIYETTSASLDVDTMDTFQLTILSTQVMNKIYDLYMQGWSVREISRRFGILPARTKFHIWTRARLYNEVLPKHGLKFFLHALEQEQEAMETHRVMDYGMDLDQMTRSQRYEQITGWQNKRVDAQRTADQYTAALAKLEKVHKFNKYDMVQVGTHGTENKKYMLKDWKIYRGKMSDEHFLRNKVFRGLMEEKRKIKAVYY